MPDIEYSILFPKEEAVFINKTLTFSINKMKSRLPCAVYFILHLYDGLGDDAEELYHTRTNASGQTEYLPAYQSNGRWVIDETYSTYYETFDIDEEFLKMGVAFQIELRTVNVTSENPLYFTECMFAEGEWNDYHEPNEIVTEVGVGFNKSSYVNLYDDSTDTYLQVIRPNRDKIFTNELTGSSCTVIAPHINSESSVDDPINLYLEFVNHTEQRIDVLR